MNKGEVNTERTATLDEEESNEKKDALRWESIDWQTVEQFINKAQTQIAKAMVKGNRKLVRELQRMLIHSHYAKLWAVRKVTSTRGKRTAGIDKDYFAKRRTRLLANRVFGTAKQAPLTKTGERPADAHLSEA